MDSNMKAQNVIMHTVLTRQAQGAVLRRLIGDAACYMTTPIVTGILTSL